MKAKLSLSICGVLLLAVQALSQHPTPKVNVAPNAPPDKPFDTTAEQTRKVEEAIKPYIEKARKTYPEAMERFLRGLPPNHGFFLTTRLRDSSGRMEQVFIAVKEIKDGRVTGLIWSDIRLVSGYKSRDSYTFPESELIDWTITRPDGSEEGNFVGNFLDTYRREPLNGTSSWRNTPATPEGMNRRIVAAANKYQSDAPIPRIVLYDIGYPLDNDEYEALDAHAVLLLTTLTQERAELPITRVYVLMNGKEVELKSFAKVLSVDTSDQTVAKTFGQYRMDSLYLLPMELRVKGSDLLVDFSQNRTAMKVAQFGTPLPPQVANLPNRSPKGTAIEKAIEKFVKREFPSFF